MKPCYLPLAELNASEPWDVGHHPCSENSQVLGLNKASAQLRQVYVKQSVAVQQKKAFVEPAQGIPNRSAGSKWPIFKRVVDLETESWTIAKVLADQMTKKSAAHHNLINPRSPKSLDVVLKKWATINLKHGLWSRLSEASQSGTKPTRQNHGLF
jgi:hypothetical protein